MSLRETQKVKYHTISFEYFSKLAELPKCAQCSFIRLLDHIDKKDNCLQLSYTDFARSSGLSNDVIKKGLKTLQQSNFVRKGIIDIHGISRYMVNPQAAWSYTGTELNFAMKVYALGSHEQAWAQRRVEMKLACLIDPNTGEITGTLGEEWVPFQPLIDDLEEAQIDDHEEMLFAA